MGLGDEARLRDIFSASINIIIVSLAVLVVLLRPSGFMLRVKSCRFPADRLPQAILIFHFAILTFAFSYMQIPYTAAVFSHEDMNVYALISCIDCVLKFIVAWLIGRTPIDGLVFLRCRFVCRYAHHPFVLCLHSPLSLCRMPLYDGERPQNLSRTSFRFRDGPCTVLSPE